MRKILNVGVLALAFATAAAPFSASAAIIVDTGTPPPSQVGPTVSRDSSNVGQSLAAQFQLNQGTTLTDVEGFIARISGTGFLISIASNGGSNLPLATLYSGSATVISDDPQWTGLHGLNWALSAGTYWVVFGASSANPFHGFMPEFAPTPLINEAVFEASPSFTWSAWNSIDIGVRITDTSSIAAPEPGTAMLMFAGLGFMAATLRRRRSRQTTFA